MKRDLSPACFLQVSEPDDNPGDAHSRCSNFSIGGSIAVMAGQFLVSWLGEVSKAPLGWETGGEGSVLGFQILVLHQGSV